MALALTTSSLFQAVVRGFTLAACIIGLLWLLDLPLDGKIMLILLAVCGVASSIAFYDGSRSAASRTTAEILMRNVHWDFTESEHSDIDDFVLSVSASQGEDSEWNPDQRILGARPLEVHITRFHRDTDTEEIIVLEPATADGWTQSRLLHALHQNVDGTSLGDATFFEGLVNTGKDQYHLLLGS